MGGLKEYYLSSEEARYSKLADALGIAWEELLMLDYEIDASVSKDGVLYNYMIVFGENCDPKVLKKIERLDENRAVYLSASFFDDEGAYYDSYEIDSILGNKNHQLNFMEEIDSLKKLLSINVEDSNLKLILYRQIFVSVIGSVETFLSDTFINEVLSSDYHMRKFVETHPEFKKQKISLSDIFSESLKIQGLAKKIMIETIYHKLHVVKKMYQQTLDIEFPDIAKMQKNIITRHDLVHRNGKTTDGQIILLDEANVLELFDSAVTLVKSICLQLEDQPF